MKSKIVFMTMISLLLIVIVYPTAAQSEITVYATAQRFESGLMIWRSDTSTIWVLTNAGHAFTFPSSSYSSFPDNPIFGNPPDRLRPIWGFGKVWGNDPPVRESVGWPTLPEIGFNMGISYSGSTVYLRQLDGSVYQINPNNTWVFANPPPPYAPYVLSFTATPNPALPGGTVTVRWLLQGTQFGILQEYDARLNASGQHNLLTSIGPLPLSESTTVVVPESATGGVIFTVWGVNRSYSMIGTYEWVVQSSITVDVASGAESTITTQAAFQQYENGFMTWRSDTGLIYTFSGLQGGIEGGWSQDSYESLPDNPFFDVPEGRVRSINGFGRVWGNNQSIRSMLGWATGMEQAYQAKIHTIPGVSLSVSLPEGRLVYVKRSWWSFQE